jgi:hypothetical protein
MSKPQAEKSVETIIIAELPENSVETIIAELPENGFVVIEGARNGTFKDFAATKLTTTAVKEGPKMGTYMNCIGKDNYPHIIGPAELKAVQDLRPNLKVLVNASGAIAKVGEIGFVGTATFFRKDGVLDAL